MAMFLSVLEEELPFPELLHAPFSFEPLLVNYFCFALRSLFTEPASRRQFAVCIANAILPN